MFFLYSRCIRDQKNKRLTQNYHYTISSPDAKESGKQEMVSYLSFGAYIPTLFIDQLTKLHVFVADSDGWLDE